MNDSRGDSAQSQSLVGTATLEEIATEILLPSSRYLADVKPSGGSCCMQANVIRITS